MIDAHAHACGIYLDCDSIADHLEKCNIEKVILCGGEPESRINYPHFMMSAIFRSEALGLRYNKFIRFSAKLKNLVKHIDEQNLTVSILSKLLPNRVLPAYWVNPNDADCIEKMDSFYAGNKFCMLKLHQCWTAFNIASPICEELIEWAERHSLPIFIHLLNREQAYTFTQVANAHPNAVFIVAHLLGFDTISRHLKSESVYFDLSSPQLYSTAMLRRALQKYGAAKLIFGSDAPYGRHNPEVILKRLKKLKVSSEDLALIIEKNINHLLAAQKAREMQTV